MLEHLLALAPSFAEVVLVTGAPEPYARYGLRSVCDLIPGRGAPGGVHAALAAAETPWVVALACDMPFVSPRVIELLLSLREAADGVCFRVGERLEPLLGCYRSDLREAWGRALADDPSFTELFARFRVRVAPEDTLRAVDPHLRSVVNVNSSDDVARLGLELPG